MGKSSARLEGSIRKRAAVFNLPEILFSPCSIGPASRNPRFTCRYRATCSHSASGPTGTETTSESGRVSIFLLTSAGMCY